MANSRKSTHKSGKVAHFPAPESAVGVQEPPETPEGVPPAFESNAPPETEAPEQKRGRGRPTDKGQPPIETDFWKRVKLVPRADWGSRVYLYLYILEPLVNLKQSGGRVYLNRYSEPVQDEHQIAMEYGSGRYRLMLAYNKISPDQSTELARHEFEIYNLQLPPKIPRAAWINDSRNAKWEALLPKETPVTPVTAANTIVDAMKMVSDIRRDVREEMEPEPGDPQSPSEMVQTFKAMKEILQPNGTAPATPADPFDTAAKIMQMRANDPMIAALMQRLDAADKAQEKAREREFELMKELRQTQAAPAKDSGDWLDKLSALAEKTEKMEGLKKLFGGLFGGTPEGAARAGRTTGYDIARDFITSPFAANLGQGLGVLLTNIAMNGARTNPGQPPVMRPPQTPVLNAQQSNGTAPPIEDPEQRINRIGQQITQAMLYEFFLKEEPGDVFAERMWEFWPEDYIFMRQFGPDNIVARYRQFAPAWAVIAPKEPAFIQFIKEFCGWDPNEEETPAPPENGDAGVVDLEEAEAN